MAGSCIQELHLSSRRRTMGFHTSPDGTQVPMQVFGMSDIGLCCLTYPSGGPSDSKYLHRPDSKSRARNRTPECPSEQDTSVSPAEHVPEGHSPAVVLSEKQREVLEMVRRRESVFFTGSAGNRYSHFFHHERKLSFCRDRKVRPTPRHH